MADASRTYPMLRRRSRRRMAWARFGRILPTRYLRLGLIAAISLGLVGTIVILARQAARPDPARELELSTKLLAAGNYNAARARAQSAIALRPEWTNAYVALTRAYLELGEGLAAEGTLARALQAGLAPAQAHAMRAHAAMLQNDADRALDETAKAGPADARYATRVRALALSMQGDYPAAQALLLASLADMPRDARAWSALGRVRLAAGDVAGAGEASARAVAIDPAYLDASVLRGQIVRIRYGLTAALPWFEAALRRDAYYVPALLAYAATLGDVGRNAAMLDASRRALAARPGDPEALYLQAVLAARAGRFMLAQALLDKTGGADADVPGVLLLGGALDYAQGRYEQAIARWRELVARQPMNIVARRLLGAALLKSGDARGALAILRPVALRRDADSYTLALVGRAFEVTGERDWAARFLDRAALPVAPGSPPFGSDDGVAAQASATAEAPGDPAAAVGYIRALLDSGAGGEAIDRARAIAAASPGASQAQSLLGDTLAVRGRMRDAAFAYARAADLRFDLGAMLRLVDARAAAGDRRGAVTALALYLDQNPRSLDARRMAANVQLTAQDWNGAIARLKSLKDAGGARDAALLAALSRAYAGSGDTAAALGSARAAYRLAPMNPLVVDAYGWAAYQRDRIADAAQLLDKAAALAPADGSIRWHQAQVLAERGRVTEARAAIAAALHDPGFVDRAAAMALARTLD